MACWKLQCPDKGLVLTARVQNACTDSPAIRFEEDGIGENQLPASLSRELSD